MRCRNPEIMKNPLTCNSWQFACLKNTEQANTKYFYRHIIFPFNHYFSTFAIDNGSLCTRLRLGSAVSVEGALPVEERMCASQSLSMENKTTRGRRGG